MALVRAFGRLTLLAQKESAPTSISLDCRRFATSAQKRKWKNRQKTNRREEKIALIVEQETAQQLTKADEIRHKGVNWRPILFLGVFPIAASGILVLSREDLRQELEEKGLGRLLRDLRTWRSQRALEAELEQHRQLLAELGKDNKNANGVVQKPTS